MTSFGDPAELVEGAGRAYADELAQPEIDRPWFCSAYTGAGYFICDPLTNVPKWCQWNMSDIWCPDDVGHEYVVGEGGSSGGAGASRTWDVEKCFDSDYKVIPCVTPDSCIQNIGLPETKYDAAGISPYFTSTRLSFTAGDSLNEKIGLKIFLDGQPVGSVNLRYNNSEIYSSYYLIGSDGLSTAFTKYFPVSDEVMKVFKARLSVVSTVAGAVSLIKEYTGMSVTFATNQYPMKADSTLCEKASSGYNFDSTARMIDYTTREPINNPQLENGYPIAPLPDPFEPVVPETTNECASIICQCIAGVVRALGVVNASVLKVDTSVMKVVSAVTNYKPNLPDPFDIKPVTVELQRILKAIDDITVEMVKEAGTNFWDVLGGAFGDIFDLIEFLIEKIIYLVIPEDSSSIVNAFDLLRADLVSKVSPIHEIQQHITDSIPNEQKEFENIKINLPKYGEVTFFKSDYLLMAIPFIRQLLSAIMVLLTAIWAYRKVSSEMVK